MQIAKYLSERKYFAQNIQNGTTFDANLHFPPYISLSIFEIIKGKQVLQPRANNWDIVLET